MQQNLYEAAYGAGFATGGVAVAVVMIAVLVIIAICRMFRDEQKLQATLAANDALMAKPQWRIADEIMDDGTAALRGMGFKEHEIAARLEWINLNQPDVADMQTFLELALTHGQDGHA